MQSLLSILPFSNTPAQGSAEPSAEGSGDGIFASLIGAEPVLAPEPAADQDIFARLETNPDVPTPWLNWLVPQAAAAPVPEETGLVPASESSAVEMTTTLTAGLAVGPVAEAGTSADTEVVDLPGPPPTPAMIADRRLDPVPGDLGSQMEKPSSLPGFPETIFAALYGGGSGRHGFPEPPHGIVPPKEPIRPKTGDIPVLAGSGDRTRPHVTLLPVGLRQPIPDISPGPAVETALQPLVVAPSTDGASDSAFALPSAAPDPLAAPDDSLVPEDRSAEVDARPAEMPTGGGTGEPGLAPAGAVVAVVPAADPSPDELPDGNADRIAAPALSRPATRPKPMDLATPAAMPTAPVAPQTLLTDWLQSLDDPSAEPGLVLVATPATQTPFAAGAATTPAALPVPQIAAQITGALARTTNGSTELTLSPEELGRVQLRLEADAANPDRMVVMISFERPETLDLFRRHAGELAEAIKAAGYSGADIGFGHEGGSQAGDRQEGFAKGGPHSSATTALPPAPERPRHTAGSSLDLRL